MNSGTVGADYLVDCRMVDTSGDSGNWERNITDDTHYVIDGDSNHDSGDSVRLQFSNDLTTPVDVQVTGEWRSN